MILTVLGSGTGWFRKNRCAPGYLVSFAEKHFLLDLGPGTLRQILKLNLNLNDISALFISHFHPDHVSDLIPYFFATRYNFGFQREEKVYLIAHERFRSFHEGLKQAFGSWVEPKEGVFEYVLIPNKCHFFSVEILGLKIKTIPVVHNPESLALRIDYQGKSLIYSGDTGYSEDLCELAFGGDLLIIECANGGEIRVPQHLGPEEVLQIAVKSKVKRVLISHLYPHSEPLPLDFFRKNFSGEIIVAKDLIRIEI